MQEPFQQLLEALRQAGSPEVALLGIGPLLTVLVVSLLSSLFVAYLYQVFYRARATGSQIYRAFPLYARLKALEGDPHPSIFFHERLVIDGPAAIEAVVAGEPPQ